MQRPERIYHAIVTYRQKAWCNNHNYAEAQSISGLVFRATTTKNKEDRLISLKQKFQSLFNFIQCIHQCANKGIGQAENHEYARVQFFFGLSPFSDKV